MLDPYSTSGPWFNIKMSSYQYRKSHNGDKTVVRCSYLHNGMISYPGKMASLYWTTPQVFRAISYWPTTNKETTRFNTSLQYYCVVNACDRIHSQLLNFLVTIVDGLVQERCNSTALAMELSLSCTNPSLSSWDSRNQAGWFQEHVAKRVCPGSELFWN